MSRHQTHHARYALHMPSKRFRYVLIATAMAVAGALLLQGLRAASFTLDSEAESGVVSASATKTALAGASGGQAVTFGAAMEAPSSLKVRTGGDSIAVVWRVPRQAFKAIEVFRNDTRIATVLPNTGVVRAERQATRYIDRDVVRGTTYQYKIRAISPSDSPSAFTATVSGRHPTSTTALPTVTIDSSQATDLADYVSTSLKNELDIWYPKMGDALAFPDYTPTNRIHIVLDPTNTGIANANQQRISINPAWLRNNFVDGGGMVIHEATHVLQNYSGSVPSWVSEGVADWTRDWFTQERFHIPAPGGMLSNAYSEGAFALQWGEVKYSANMIRKVNIAARNGTYTANLIADLTGGRSGEQLYVEAKQQHYGTTGQVAGRGKCIDVVNGNLTLGTKLQLSDCNNASAQRWTIVYHDAGLHGTAKTILSFANSAIIADGRCFDVTSSGTADGTGVQSWQCNYSNAQRWMRGPGDSLVNINSGKCLATTGGSTTNGTPLIIMPCDGSPSQAWSIPQ